MATKRVPLGEGMGRICVLGCFREEMVAIWQEREFGWAEMTKEGYVLIKMRVETVGYGKRERQFVLVYDMGEIMVFQCLVAR